MAKILIIDDSRTVALMFCRYFQNIGHEVLIANDGPGGLALAQQKHPDLLVLDRLMPGMDGMDVCRTLKSDPQHKTIKVLMVTGSSDDELRKKSEEAGVDVLLTKDCGLGSVLDVAARLLEAEIAP